MDSADRDLVSHYLVVRPIVVRAGGLSQVRRKRYLWATWRMHDSVGVTVEEKEHAWAVHLQASLPDPSLWVTPGWGLIGGADIRGDPITRTCT